MTRAITFAVASNRRYSLDSILLTSPIFNGADRPQLLVQEGYRSAAAAYNEAIERSENDLIVFLHDDMYLPEEWVGELQASIERLAKTDPNWGVLGCSGQTHDNQNRGYVYSHGLGIIGEPFEEPRRVQTLDEILLIIRKSSGLRFDEAIPHFHMYGADLCMTAASRGMNSYAISAYCIHNTQYGPALSGEFYEAYRAFRRKWKDALPVYTTCVQVTKLNGYIYERRLREAYRLYVRRDKTEERVRNTQALVETARAMRRQS